MWLAFLSLVVLLWRRVALYPRLRACVRAGTGKVMIIDYLIGLGVAMLLTIYLIYALMYPERF